MSSAPYAWLLLAGIAVSLFTWTRLARRDDRLVLIYIAALVCAFLGAKLVFLAAEGWMFWDAPDRWRIWATGKTILGALLGGYAGVEGAKKLTSYTAPTGDLFALVAPLGILLGRIGCLLHGCCLGRECAPAWWTLGDARGVARWPAVAAEIAFNAIALAAFVSLRRGESFGFLVSSFGSRAIPARTAAAAAQQPETLNPKPETFPLAGQHFHLYLIAYGLFRFAHEFLRATPRMASPFSGYQLAALAVAVLGAWGFVRRRQASRTGAA